MIRPKRKPIPKWVKSLVLARQQMTCTECCEALGPDTEYDHRPSILMRYVNEAGTDYIPSQNDPDHIEALHKACHLKRTVGRIPGAEKTTTVKGSDAWLAAKFRKLERAPRPKARIASRPFPKKKRKLRI